jgi:1-deoxy-D-xylulose-5-phosphate reductoisomerase
MVLRSRDPAAALAMVQPRAPLRMSIFGATGSVGTSTLDVIAAAPPGRFDVAALTAHSNVADLADAALRTNAEIAVIADPDRYRELSDALSSTGIEVAAGPSGLLEAADRDVGCVMGAIMGAAGLQPTLAAARRADRLAIANKECLVIAGELFLAQLRETQTEIIPVDSEHAAVYQVIHDRAPDTICRIVLTASGGPFRDWPLERIAEATCADALNHPSWKMGSKITVDSATMMNKGLELIEAHHLFALAPDQLDALIHPQSLVHCLVEFCDGSLVAQFARPDMKVPIAQSLYWPERRDTPDERFDYTKLADIDFRPVDPERFPAFTLARDALACGGLAPAVLNGANEAAVAAFLAGQIDFLDIARTVSETLEKADRDGILATTVTLESALAADQTARDLARDVMGAM